SASVRQPNVRMSSAVTIVTDEGASVTRCSRRAAPETGPTPPPHLLPRLAPGAAEDGPHLARHQVLEALVRERRGIGRRCLGAGGRGDCGEDGQGEKGGRRGQSHWKSYPTMRARRSRWELIWRRARAAAVVLAS